MLEHESCIAVLFVAYFLLFIVSFVRFMLLLFIAIIEMYI